MLRYAYVIIAYNKNNRTCERTVTHYIIIKSIFKVNLIDCNEIFGFVCRFQQP